MRRFSMSMGHNDVPRRGKNFRITQKNPVLAHLEDYRAISLIQVYITKTIRTTKYSLYNGSSKGWLTVI